MNIWPMSLPAFSNREDFLQTIQFMDDETGDPINVSGIVGVGTFASWNVRAGATITTSVTPMTIPVFPFGSQLSALAFVVPTGLNIHANDPIVIADLAGVNTMTGYVLSYNTLTGAIVAQIGMTFQFEIRGPSSPWLCNDGYSPFPQGIGVDSGYAPLLTASLANGKILFLEASTIQILILETEIRRLWNKTYMAGLSLTDSYNTRQVYIASLPSIYGGVTR